jgi:hypothetical protein
MVVGAIIVAIERALGLREKIEAPGARAGADYRSVILGNRYWLIS